MRDLPDIKYYTGQLCHIDDVDAPPMFETHGHLTVGSAIRAMNEHIEIYRPLDHISFDDDGGVIVVDENGDPVARMMVSDDD